MSISVSNPESSQKLLQIQIHKCNNFATFLIIILYHLYCNNVKVKNMVFDLIKKKLNEVTEFSMS